MRQQLAWTALLATTVQAVEMLSLQLVARESTQVAGQQIAPYVNQATIVTQAQQGLENACMKNEKCKGRRGEHV